jgi:hypothetical protein
LQERKILFANTHSLLTRSIHTYQPFAALLRRLTSLVGCQSGRAGTRILLAVQIGVAISRKFAVFSDNSAVASLHLALPLCEPALHEGSIRVAYFSRVADVGRHIVQLGRVRLTSAQEHLCRTVYVGVAILTLG